MYAGAMITSSDRVVSRWMQGILFSSVIALVHCGGAASPPQGHEGTKKPDSSTNAPTGAPAGELCGDKVVCAEALLCKSPEAYSWNDCGAPSEPKCEPGFIGDACGNCLRRCDAKTPCPDGTTCNGSTCHHPSRCVPPTEPKP